MNTFLYKNPKTKWILKSGSDVLIERDFFIANRTKKFSFEHDHQNLLALANIIPENVFGFIHLTAIMKGVIEQTIDMTYNEIFANIDKEIKQCL